MNKSFQYMFANFRNKLNKLKKATKLRALISFVIPPGYFAIAFAINDVTFKTFKEHKMQAFLW